MQNKPLVEIQFLDHCHVVGGIQKPIPCTVYGLLVGEDEDAYYVCSWIAGDELDDNADTYAILKKAVKKFKKIRK